MNSSWINRRILISPNELLEGGGHGILIANDARALSLTLSKPMLLPNGKACSHLVAYVRHENRTLNEIMDGRAVLCALTLVPDEKFDPKKPCDVSWWRGGGAAIGDIRAVTPDSPPSTPRG
jgi:hypothetical protein